MSANLQLTDEHIMIRDAAADFLAARCDSIALRKTVDAAFAGQGDGVDAALWQAFGQELGYCGLSMPEEVGGLNLGMTELTLVMEQLGKRLAPVPFFQSSVLAAGVLQYACESAGGAQSHLEALASGEQTASLLMDANAGSSEAIFGNISAKTDGAHYLLSGGVAQAFASANSDFFVLTARLTDSQEAAIFVLPQGTAGLQLTLDQKIYNEIIMTRVTVPVGEDIGFLPGTEEEKMTPWMGALEDNLDVLMGADNHEGGDWGRAASNELIRSRVKVKSLNFMRGRTFLNKLLIIDEAQNLTPKQMKTLVTRAGPGTKIVCLGNLAQIDTPYLTEGSSGLTYAVDRFKGWPHGGHVTLARGERSRLADFASEVL